MFRSLFIGLVILSALTAEGAVGLPQNYGSFYLFINKGLSLLHENTEASGKIQEIKAAAKPFGKAFRNAYPLSSGSIHKSKSPISGINSNEIYKTGSVKVTAVIDLIPFSGDDKDAVLKKSDSSPPIA